MQLVAYVNKTPDLLLLAASALDVRVTGDEVRAAEEALKRGVPGHVYPRAAAKAAAEAEAAEAAQVGGRTCSDLSDGAQDQYRRRQADCSLF